MRVKATDKYKKLNIQDKELKRVPEAGEIFEISKERYIVLTQKNEFNEVFVEKVEENNKIETTNKKITSEKAIKRKGNVKDDI